VTPSALSSTVCRRPPCAADFSIVKIASTVCQQRVQEGRKGEVRRSWSAAAIKLKHPYLQIFETLPSHNRTLHTLPYRSCEAVAGPAQAYRACTEHDRPSSRSILSLGGQASCQEQAKDRMELSAIKLLWKLVWMQQRFSAARRATSLIPLLEG
jgi:hypothetical protein